MFIVPVRLADEEFHTQHIQGKSLCVRIILKLAWIVAVVLHLGQSRRCGGRAVEHPMVVSQIVAEFGLGVVAQAAALLHDVVEDMRGFMKLIAVLLVFMFGPVVLIMTVALTKWSKDTHGYFRQIIFLTRWFWPIIVIKLIDRLHNLICPYGGNAEREKRMLKETIRPFSAMCRICRRFIPVRFLPKYDELRHRVRLLALQRLAEIESQPAL